MPGYSSGNRVGTKRLVFYRIFQQNTENIYKFHISPHFHQEIFPFESIFCVGFLVGVAHGIAQQQVLFA